MVLRVNAMESYLTSQSDILDPVKAYRISAMLGGLYFATLIVAWLIENDDLGLAIILWAALQGVMSAGLAAAYLNDQSVRTHRIALLGFVAGTLAFIASGHILGFVDLSDRDTFLRIAAAIALGLTFFMILFLWSMKRFSWFAAEGDKKFQDLLLKMKYAERWGSLLQAVLFPRDTVFRTLSRKRKILFITASFEIMIVNSVLMFLLMSKIGEVTKGGTVAPLVLMFAIPATVSIGFVVLMGLFRLEYSEKRNVETELKVAHDMQMGLMPLEDPVVPGYDISGICIPASEVGGDFFDYVWLDQKKTKLGIAVADVSGKAMKAAITAVMTSGMIYREVGGNQSPKSIMRKINKPMYAKLDRRMFTALSFAMIDTKKKELRFSNAGQAYPVLKRRKDVIPLEVKGARLPLGVKEDVLYGEMVVKLKKGDTVVFYTDGIPEAKNEKDEFYGFDRFKSLAAGMQDESAKEIRDRILADVNSFTGKSPQYDDMTVVVIKVG